MQVKLLATLKVLFAPHIWLCVWVHACAHTIWAYVFVFASLYVFLCRDWYIFFLLLSNCLLSANARFSSSRLLNIFMLISMCACVFLCYNSIAFYLLCVYVCMRLSKGGHPYKIIYINGWMNKVAKKNCKQFQKRKKNVLKWNGIQTGDRMCVWLFRSTWLKKHKLLAASLDVFTAQKFKK